MELESGSIFFYFCKKIEEKANLGLGKHSKVKTEAYFMLSHKDARALISQILTPLSSVTLSVTDALAHAVCRDIHVIEDFPAFDNSAMDGYAVRKSDIRELPVRLPVSMELAAGSNDEQILPEGCAARIFTGARLPHGADCIVKQEDTLSILGEKEVEFKDELEHADFIRRKGEDLRSGDCLIAKGSRLGPAQIACLAAQGIYEIEVTKKPSIGYLMTGDELRFRGDNVLEGQIRSCNGELFHTFFDSMSSSITDYGYVRDDYDALKSKLLAASQEDIFLISGGASVGKYDFTRRLLEELNYKIHFSKISVRPGKPLIFATKGSQTVFGVPGNPVSTFIACKLFISHAVAVKSGWNRKLKRIKAAINKQYKKTEKFDMYLRGILHTDNGQNIVDIDLNQSSGALGSLSKANCLVLLPAGKSVFTEGEIVDVLPIAEWGVWN